MKFGEIKELLNSGFTPEQITTLATSGTIPSVPEIPEADPITPASPVESPAETEGVTLAPSVDAENTEPAAPDPEADPLEALREQLRSIQEENKQLREMLQNNNIRDQHFSSPKPENDAASIMAKIIRPDIKERS